MKMNKSVALGAAMGLAALTALAGPASAETRWGLRHPRQHEVLGRTASQSARIHYDRTHGLISGQEAHDLHAQDRAIAGEDHADSKANGGYITKGQQHALNQEENALSKEIHDEAH